MIWNHHPIYSRIALLNRVSGGMILLGNTSLAKDDNHDRRPNFWMISDALLSQKKHVCRLGEHHPIFLVMVDWGKTDPFGQVKSGSFEAKMVQLDQR